MRLQKNIGELLISCSLNIIVKGEKNVRKQNANSPNRGTSGKRP